MNDYLFQIFFFFIISCCLTVVSWRSLKVSRSHGFARFFAWEALAGLILFNAPSWFTTPFSPRQIISWLLLFGSIPVAVHGFWLLKQIGKPKEPNLELDSGTHPANFAFENTSTLVTIGAYHYIRHPLYSSLLMLGTGAWLKDISMLSSLLFIGIIGCLYLTAHLEEVENQARFGQAYTIYMQKTSMFIPFLFLR